MQTHEWEALLDGTTEGQWEATDERDDMGIIGSDGFTLIDVNEGWSRCTRADLTLAAHAPAAVAEVIRLRRRLERMCENYELVAIHANHPQALGVVHQINDDLARILEGDTDE